MTVLAIIAALVIGRLCGRIDAEMRADDAAAEAAMWNDPTVTIVLPTGPTAPSGISPLPKGVRRG